MAWTIRFKKSAEKEFKKLPRPIQQAIHSYITTKLLPLEDPRLIGKPLVHSMSGYWRYRIDKYRMICRFKDDELIIHVVRVAKRDKVYRD